MVYQNRPIILHAANLRDMAKGQTRAAGKNHHGTRTRPVAAAILTRCIFPPAPGITMKRKSGIALNELDAVKTSCLRCGGAIKTDENRQRKKRKEASQAVMSSHARKVNGSVRCWRQKKGWIAEKFRQDF